MYYITNFCIKIVTHKKDGNKFIPSLINYRVTFQVLSKRPKLLQHLSISPDAIFKLNQPKINR